MTGREVTGIGVVVAIAALLGGCDGGNAGRVGAADTSRPRAAASPRVLRVCADPNNLPFSNDRLEGFENQLAALVARDLHARLEYYWWAQRRGFFRNTLNAGACDAVMGVVSSLEMALTTNPYYRSTYVFVTRRDSPLRPASFDDRTLRRARIGVQIVGDDFSNTPPAHALTSRGIVGNIVGFSLYGDYARPNPPAAIIEAVAERRVDVAVAWGPLAGFFATRSPVPLRLTPVSPQIDLPFLPFVYDISMAVRRRDPALRDELNAFIDRRRPEIDRLLASYGVPRVDAVEEVQP